MAALSNQIFVGSLENPTYYFENDAISAATSMQAVALVGQDLSVDSFSPEVADSWENVHNVKLLITEDDKQIRTEDGKIFAINVDQTPQASEIIDLDYGTPVWYFNSGNLIGKFYIDHVTRQGANRYQMNCVSAIGLLEKMYHKGGLYASTTFGDLLGEILAGENGLPVIDYEMDFDVSTVTVSGWLPHDTKRANLYQLIFANGVNIIKSPDGTPRFTFIRAAAEDSEEIADSDIYFGGSVDYQTRYSQISVTEHTYAYIAEDDPVSLYDNSTGDAVLNEQIWFSNAPVYVNSIVATDGLTIVSKTENGAVISGVGKLTGIPYVHATKTVTMDAENYSGDAKIVSVENCTLVSLINSNNLAQRLYNFYCSRPNNMIKVIKNSIRYKGERCGKPYRFKNPFGESENAYLAEMDINASSFNRADCVWYADYEPAGQMGLYQNSVLLTGSGTFVVPAGVQQIYVVMIGGGTGGSSGSPGKNGGDATTYVNVSASKNISKMWYGAEGGDGGAGGAGGQPGRVLKTTISGDDLLAAYSYSCGTGGEGGAATGPLPDTESELRAALAAEYPGVEYEDDQIEAMIAQQQAYSGTWESNAGSAGTATTFGSMSTNDTGSYVPTSAGVYDPINARYYAQKGNTGVKGGKGGARQVANTDGTAYWTTDGETVIYGDTAYMGGRGGQNNSTPPEDLPEAVFTAYGGNGAGAAVGISRDTHPNINGSDAPAATWRITNG